MAFATELIKEWDRLAGVLLLAVIENADAFTDRQHWLLVQGNAIIVNRRRHPVMPQLDQLLF